MSVSNSWLLCSTLSFRVSRVCCFVLLDQYWGIVTVPGSFLKAGNLGWPDPHPPVMVLIENAGPYGLGGPPNVARCEKSFLFEY